MTETEIKPEIRNAIEEVVRAELGRFGIANVEVQDEEDADGDPALYVYVHYRDPGTRPDPSIMARTGPKLNDRLAHTAERRFVYLYHRVPEAERQASAR